MNMKICFGYICTHNMDYSQNDYKCSHAYTHVYAHARQTYIIASIILVLPDLLKSHIHIVILYLYGQQMNLKLKKLLIS